MEMHIDIFGWDDDLQKGVCNQVQTKRFVQIIEMEVPERDERKA